MKLQQIAKCIGISKMGCLLVQSVKEPRPGYQHEWEVTHYAFTKDPVDTCCKLGLTVGEFNNWKDQIRY